MLLLLLPRTLWCSLQVKGVLSAKSLPQMFLPAEAFGVQFHPKDGFIQCENPHNVLKEFWTLHFPESTRNRMLAKIDTTGPLSTSDVNT
jgi:hypothetical protein